MKGYGLAHLGKWHWEGVVVSSYKAQVFEPLDLENFVCAIEDGSRSGYNIGIEVNSAGFLFMKFLLGLVFVLGLGFALGLGYVGNGFCGCYWEGLCG